MGKRSARRQSWSSGEDGKPNIPDYETDRRVKRDKAVKAAMAQLLADRERLAARAAERERAQAERREREAQAASAQTGQAGEAAASARAEPNSAEPPARRRRVSYDCAEEG